MANAHAGATEQADLILHATATGWTVFHWPLDAVGRERPAARHISRALATVASCVFVYDGDYWSHVMFQGGREVDRFTSVPGYFDDDPATVARQAAQYIG